MEGKSISAYLRSNLQYILSGEIELIFQMWRLLAGSYRVLHLLLESAFLKAEATPHWLSTSGEAWERSIYSPSAAYKVCRNL
jgi:hypothetical protein